MTNQIKTLLLMALISGLLIVIGGLLGGKAGMIIALIIALALNAGAYWGSDRIVLAAYGVKPITPDQAPALYAMVQELAERASLPMPRVAIIPEQAPNAFATGRDPEHGVVAVTQGLLQMLSADELRGVLAHEISHIKNRDVLIQSVAGVMAAAITFAASMLQWNVIFGGRNSNGEGGGNPIFALLMAMLAPIAAMLIQMGISRSREYIADESGARLAGSPLGLASALGKLQQANKRIPMQHGSEATSHLFIIHPLHPGKLAGLFSTHPPTEERIARLHGMLAHTGR